MKLPDAYLKRKLNRDELPPWTGDGRRMIEWVIQELNLIFELECEERRNMSEVEEELLLAKHGDIEPLRRLYPQLGPFLNLPKPPDHSRRPLLPDVPREVGVRVVTLNDNYRDPPPPYL